jgi:hypothetical protein
MFQLTYRWFRRGTASTVGLSEAAPAETIAARLAQRTGGARERYESVLSACDRAAAATRLSGRGSAALLRQLAVIEREVLDGDRAGN